MKRIYQNNDLIINLSVCDFPINKNMINSIEFKFFTINPSNCIVKSHNDINEHNQVILQWDELKNLEEGVLFYDYKISLVNNELNDGTKDNSMDIVNKMKKRVIEIEKGVIESDEVKGKNKWER